MTPAELYRAHYVDLAAQIFNENALVLRTLEEEDAAPDTLTTSCPDICGKYVNERTYQSLVIKDRNGVLRVRISGGSKSSRLMRFVRKGELFRICSLVEDDSPGLAIDRFWKNLEFQIDQAENVVTCLSRRGTYLVDRFVRETTTDEFDGSSVISIDDVPSLSSSLTFSSSASVGEILRAANEFVALLLRDEVLNSVDAKTLERIGIEKFERNLSRILKHYAIDLRAEANDILEKGAVRLVKTRASYIANCVRRKLDPIKDDSYETMHGLSLQNTQGEELLERFLQVSQTAELDSSEMDLAVDDKQPVEDAEPPDDGPESTDESDSDEPGRPHLIHLGRVEKFMVESKAFVKLREKFSVFVSRAAEINRGQTSKEETEKTINHDVVEVTLDTINMAIPNTEVSNVHNFVTSTFRDGISAAYKLALDLLRPRLLKGHKRITWTCGCGKTMYADVEECYTGSAQHLQASLRKSAAAAGQSLSNQSGPMILPPTPLSNSNSQHSASTSQQQSSNLNAVDGSNTLTNTAAAQGQYVPCERFLLLCVNTSTTVKLEQLPVSYTSGDQVLFQDIRRAYIEMRKARANFHPNMPTIIVNTLIWFHKKLGQVQKIIIRLFEVFRLNWAVWWIGDIVFYIPISANFVRFELIPIKTEICPEVLEFPALPSENEVNKNNYHYAPCPKDIYNPVLRIPYLHSLFQPGIHLDDFWINRIPKKLNRKISYTSGSNPVIGWGVHIVEGPNWMALYVITTILLSLSLVLSVVYSILKKDISSGFAMGSYVVAALTIVNALGIVLLSQRN